MANQPVSALDIWLKERLRDAIMWPVNLFREFPVRSGRLIQIIWWGIVGIGRFLPEMFTSSRNGELSSFFVQTGKGFGNWTHELINQLFDLVGGPEIAQFFMHLITNTTPLSDEELEIITPVIGPGKMRYQDVRVAEGGLLDIVFKHNGNLAFTTWHTIHFPRQDRGNARASHTRANRKILIHEITHVYQYERVGSKYLGEAIYMLVTTKRNCYDYGSIPGLQDAIVEGKQYCDFNREQQAQIVQDYYALAQRGVDTTVYESFIGQMRAGKL